MIVVAIIGILAAVAIPSYNDYVRRGQLPEAFNQLADYRTKMEQYYQDNRNYGTPAACAADATANAWHDFTPSNAKFTYSCATGTRTGDTTQQSYTLTATGKPGLVFGYEYTIDQDGNRKTTKFKGATVNQDCWLTKASAC